MSVTIKQIAELANVSRGTVDKVLNHRPGVKPETKGKVLKIAKELNYEPNFLGKALVQSREPQRIGIVLTPEYNPFIQEMLLGVQQAENEYKAFGITISIKMPISLEPAEQISILNELENENMNGIAVFPIDDNNVRNKINQLIEKGIAVITFNSKLTGTNDFCFVGQDHKKGGRTAAGLMCKMLPDGGNIAMIISSYHLSCHQDRLQGFKERIQEANLPIHITSVSENQDKRDEAFKQTLTLFNQYPDVKGIYITGGGVVGVANALDMLEKKHSTILICHDLVPDTVPFLQNGTIDFVLGQSPEFQGYQLVKILFEYLIKKRKPATDYLEIPITITTQDSY